MNQKAPLPGATMPFGYLASEAGPWQPPFPKYGTKLVSPPIEPTALNWPEGAPQTGAMPQFVTDTGQQIGEIFFFFGTAVSDPNGVFEGYLGSPADMDIWPPKMHGTPGPITYENTQVMDPNNWEGIVGQPVKACKPPAG